MKQIIEALAQRIVLLEAGDLPGLAEMHTLFERLASEQEAGEAAEAWLTAYSRASADRVQAILLEEITDTAAAMTELAAGITALQQLLVDRRDPQEIRLPDDLAGLLGAAAAETRSLTAVPPHASGDEAPAVTEGHPAPDASAGESLTVPFTGDTDLTAEFVLEAREHLDAADACLLTLENQPEDADGINALFRAFHTLKGVAGFLDLQAVGRLAHQTENLLDRARQGQVLLTGERLEVVFDATDMMKKLVHFVAEALSSGVLCSDAALPRLIERLVICADPAYAGEVSGRTESPRPPAAPFTESEALPVPAGAGLEPTTDEKAPSGAPLMRETVKVDSHRLDAMIDAIGELVIAEAMVTQSPRLRSVADEAVAARLNHLSKITRELQEMATSLRMVPVRATFQRMARLARDTAKKLQKQIVFSTVGEDTELDKNVVDQIGDPLIHMVRNAVDHGLEKRPEDRVAAGKDPVGRVELRAYHKGGSIFIEIADDGGGLDRDRILAKAIERGLVREDQKLSDAEIYPLIMEPGFSTATVISDVSGRGVGMDVVKKNIQAMRGQIDIQSVPGRGTTFSIRLPLTLAIIEGMVVRVGAQRYVVPMLSITRMLRPEECQLPTVFGAAEMLLADEGLMPLHRLHALFDVPDAVTDPTAAAVVVVEHEGRRLGLLIDELLGQQQIVIKSLGESLRGASGIAGGAIMPDGKVGLILDIDGLVRLAGEKRG